MNLAFDENGRLLTLSERSGKKPKPPTRPLEGSRLAQVLELLESEFPNGMKAKRIAQVLGISQNSAQGAICHLRRDWVYGVPDGGHGKRYYALQRGE